MPTNKFQYFMRPNWNTPEIVNLQNRQEVLAANELMTARRKQWEPDYERKYWEVPPDNLKVMELSPLTSGVLLSLMEQVRKERQAGVRTLEVSDPEFVIGMLQQYRAARAFIEFWREGLEV